MFYLLDSVLVSNIKLVQHELNLFISLMLQVLGLFHDLRVLLIRIHNSWILL